MGTVRAVWAVVLAATMLASIAGVALGEEAAPLDINRATAQELEALPGVGPALAKRIVEFREIHGAFKSVEDLLKVQGIGEKVLARLRDRVTVSRSKR
jgi:competence protein ComEA